MFAVILAWSKMLAVRRFPFKGHCSLFVQLQRWVSGYFCGTFLIWFCCICLFSFNIWHAALAYFSGVGKVLSYEIESIISGFCFDINTKWRVKLNNASFYISFVAVNNFRLRGNTSKFTDNRIILRLFGMFLLIH